MIPDIDAKLFTLSASAIGFLLIDDMSANEQNALGNWLMLVAQVLCTNAVYQQLANSRRTDQYHYNNDTNTIEILKKMVKALNQEIEEIKRNINDKI